MAHRRVMVGFTLAMMAISWPIWHSTGAMPRFPVQGLEFVARDRPVLDTAALAVCLLGLTVSFMNGRPGRLGAAATAVSALALILLDQNRLQAWFYQTLVLSAVYVLLPAGSALGFVRFFAVALYAHSALSKLDWSFAHSMGPSLISPMFDRLPMTLDAQLQTLVVLLMPIGELIFAMALACGFWRVGLGGATVMHLGLLALLGPWSLDHSGNVLFWNVSMLIQAWIVFRPADFRGHPEEEEPGECPEMTQRPLNIDTQPGALGIVQLGMLAVAILPFFERAGLWDPWPSFALYAGHVEQLRIDWPAELRHEIPAEYQPFLKADQNDLFLDLTLWSRARFGVPPYPATRIHKRLAAWIAETCPEGMPMRATFLSKANWRSGARTETVLTSAREIRNR